MKFYLVSNIIQASDTIKSVNKVWSTIDVNEIEDSKSILERSANTVCITTDTKKLPKGAYTNWWVIFNEPVYCNNPAPFGNATCGELDIGNPDVRATVMWSASGIVGVDGKAHFNACLDKGEITHQLLMGSADGLVNPLTAEIHLVIRHHGPANYNDPLLLGNQLSSFLGGCEDLTQGIIGFNCQDPQYIVHTILEQ